uniref:Uncharacterized protein n=1 Tax=Magallana gigas TaxID=29159 RepID=K1QM43_MAGGI
MTVTNSDSVVLYTNSTTCCSGNLTIHYNIDWSGCTDTRQSNMTVTNSDYVVLYRTSTTCCSGNLRILYNADWSGCTDTRQNNMTVTNSDSVVLYRNSTTCCSGNLSIIYNEEVRSPKVTRKGLLTEYFTTAVFHPTILLVFDLKYEESTKIFTKQLKSDRDKLLNSDVKAAQRIYIKLPVKPEGLLSRFDHAPTNFISR